MALEDIVKSLATSTHTFQNETRASIKNLEQQVSQLATSVGRLESQGTLPGQTENNPKQNVSVISLRSGKSYESPRKSEPEEEAEKETEGVMEEKEAEKVEKRDSQASQANSEGVQVSSIIPIETEEHGLRARGRGDHGHLS